MEEENKKAGFPAFLLMLGLGVMSFFIWLFAELAEELLENELKSFDGAVISFFRSIENPALDKGYIVITELGSVWFLTTLSVITLSLLWLKAKDKWGILFFIIAVGGGALLSVLLKNLYERGRPSINEEIDAIGFSFPSGHSMGSLIFYGFIAYFIVRSRLKKGMKILSLIILGVLVVLIGTSRIYLGAHFPSDVVAGYSAGTIWLILCLLALEWVQWQSGSHVRPVQAIRRFLVSNFKSAKRRIRR
ncbi:phosphatase PAP2 family protein [Planomicrobium sp. CPCC 101079]|uniref:phosphatase PAP2 family protein n=1 Tax=Planomicrobium sp. CPCC 101079 TaxID=2599618 RepID=UPI0011B4C852|nr:phosphatase PAP2 family protein [Planomicrobium sp. CPCC 101079]TWT09189.1 phosphatase PAP2 family protein [Planomicrobium sp. CPCC 101079]